MGHDILLKTLEKSAVGDAPWYGVEVRWQSGYAASQPAPHAARQIGLIPMLRAIHDAHTCTPLRLTKFTL